MAETESTSTPTFWERINRLPSTWLYLILMIVATVSLLPTVQVPTEPDKYTKDLFATLMQIPEGSTVLVHSDWTVSTRGENAAQMESLLRLLMRRKIKFAVACIGDARAPQVAKDTIARINQERKDAGEPEYRKWEDYVEVGFFANVEGTLNAMANNLQTAWGGRKDIKPGSGPTDVFESPVLQNVKKVENAALIIDIHASDVAYTMIERLNGKVPLASMCTGVMGPDTLNYYFSGQLKGVAIGLNGAVAFETLMERGLDPNGAGGAVKGENLPHIDGFKGQKNFGRGMSYYLALHSSLALLILAVIVGNVGMALSRKGKAA